MTNDRADDGDEGGDGLNSPGGGPRRVVSERSVDDIFESVTNDDAGDGSRSSARETRVEQDPVAPPDGAGADEPDESGADDREPTPDAGSALEEKGDESGLEDEEDGESVIDEEGRDGPALEVEEASSRVEDGADDPADEGDDASAGGESADVDPASSADELAARVEAGDVTGADVRAAEAGEGREPTPDIDEVDLSLGDLDDAAGPSPTRDPASDAGPLAGSIDEERGGRATADGTDGADDADDADDDSPGLVGRLRGLFSRSSYSNN